MRRWHVAALALSITAALGAGAAWHAASLRAALYERVERRLEGNAASTETAVERWIEERRYDAATVAGEVMTRIGTPSSEDALHRDFATRDVSLLLRRMRTGHGYLNIWVLDPEGHLLGSAAPGMPSQAEVHAALASASSGMARICEPFTSAEDGRMRLCYAASPAAAGGAAVDLPATGPAPFVVVLRSDPHGSLLPLLESAAAAGGSERGRLVDHTLAGLIVLGSSRSADGHDEPVRLPADRVPQVLQRAVSGQPAHGVYRDFDGRIVIAGARPVRGTDWAVVRQVDQAEIDLAYRGELQSEAFAFVAVLCAIGLGLLGVSRSERTRRLREVAASERRLADTLRSSLDAVIVIDESERITFFNAAAERTFRCRADDVLGKSVSVLAPADRREAQLKGMRGFIAGNTQSVLFTATSPLATCVRADGELFPIEGAITRGGAGEERIYTLIVRDVTDRLRHQEEREHSLSLLRATLESTADGILVVDMAAHTTAYNRKFVDLWGLPDDLVAAGDDAALVGYARQRLRHPDTFTERVAHLYNDPLAESYDLLEFLDGRTVERVSRPQRLGDRVVGRVWSFRDVTARELAAAALRRSEASARAFVERSPYGICRVTADGLFMSANPAIVAMLGYPSEEAILRGDVGALYADPSVRTALVRRHERGEDSIEAEVVWRRVDGSDLPVRISSQVVRDARGKTLHYLFYVENLAPLRSAEQALRQAEKLAAVGQFVSGVAHELNNPLAAVLLFTENLMEDSALGHERDTLSMLREQANRARAIVRDLLSFVRGTHGTAAPHAAGDVLARAVRALEPQAAAVGSSLQLVAGEELGWVHVDRGAIEQVLTNLVVNALQAAPGGTVRIAARAVDGMLRVVVEDEGAGIPADVLPRVFEPFFTTKPVGTGTGLGLSVSLGIVERHGGSLFAANAPAPGRGARMTFTLPLALPPIAPVVTPPPATEVTELGPVRRVLVVDDEGAIRRALARFFTRRHWLVDEASDGAEALERLLSDVDYDLVISDLRMPGVSGIAMHDRLAVARPGLLDRLVFSTGDVVSREAAEFIARTGCSVIEKPFQFAALDALVGQITARTTNTRATTTAVAAVA